MNNFVKSLNKKTVLYIGAWLFFILAFIIGLTVGSTSLSLSDIFDAITKKTVADTVFRIFYFVRLPRTVACLLCGGALSVSGYIIQHVLNNRLASPSIIGVNSGAGLAVTLCAAFGIYGGFSLSLFSFIGAFLTVMIISLTSKKLGSSKSTVILTGIAVNSILSAVSDAITTFKPNIALISRDFKIGDFSSVTYEKIVPASIIILISLIFLFTLSNELDILSFGEENATGLGLNVNLSRTLFLLLSALLAGCAVSLAGLISFVGLIVPHAVRKIAGNTQTALMPLCALFGAGFLCLCDTLSRTLFSPFEIPVGIIMSFIGGPFFIFILIKRKGGHRNA